MSSVAQDIFFPNRLFDPSTTQGLRSSYSERRSRNADMIAGEELSLKNRLNKLETVLSQLDRIAGMSRGWDGYSAEPVSDFALNSALEFAYSFIVQRCVPVPQIVPTPTGGVQFEWHENGIDLEIEFGPSSEIDVFFEDLDTGDTQELPLRSDLREVAPLLHRLCT